MAEIRIKKGSINLVANKAELMDVSETADGMSFTFKDGLQLYLTDAYMPAAFKQQIKLTVDRFEGATVNIDFDNVKKPVLVEL
jgi:hypothetical protein